MRENIYVIYDNAANIALKPPMISANDVEPIRTLQQATQHPESTMAKYPAEFTLIHIGTVDLETLVVMGEERPRIVAQAIDLIPKTE